MPVTAGVRALLGVFGPMLQAAGAAGRGPANMWATYTAAYARLGVERPPASIFDMNQFVAGLGRILVGMGNLAGAADESALTAGMWAPPIGYTALPTDTANPSMLATFQVVIDTAAGQETRWSSVAYNTILPVTVGEIRTDAITRMQAQMDAAAMEEGTESPTAGGTVVGLGDMYLIAKGLS